MNSRIRLASLAAAVLALTACSASQAQPLGSGSSGPEYGAEYGVVADPPLPRSAPVAPLSESNTLADHDGSVVVSLLAASENSDDRPTIRFVEAGALDQPIDARVGAGPDAELRAVSADGSRAALFERLNGPGGETSRITVIDRTSHPIEQASYELPGLVEPEAFSTDGGRLFVIDHSGSAEPGSYRVRPFDLASGVLQNILGPTKVPFDDEMNGVGRRQVWSPQGDRLYTLYIRQTHHHHHGDESQDGDRSVDSGDHGHPEPGTDGFVHVLDLREEWAFCLDLPPTFGGGELSSTALAISPDGETVAVADLAAQAVAFASTTELVVTDTRPLPDLELGVNPNPGSDGDAELHLGLSGDATLFLASGSAGRWHDGITMEPLGPEPDQFQHPVRGLTSLFGGVLVWTGDLAVPPVELNSPVRPGT